MNYSELTASVQTYAENDEATFVAEIPTFIRQAEERIVRSVMIPELRKNVTGTMTANNRYLARPTDMLSVFSMAVVDGSGDYSYLKDKDVNFIREAYPDPTDTGLPLYYAQFEGDTVSDDGVFVLGPTPDANYTVELYYYYDPPSIVTDSTSWLGNYAESALLYGTLIEAYTFMKGDADIMQVYMQRYQEALAQLQKLAVRSTRDDYNDGRLG